MTPGLVTHAVAVEWEVTSDEIRSGWRNRHVTEARHVVWYLCATILEMGAAEIATRHDVTPSAVSRAVNKLADRIPNEPSLVERLEAVERALL